MIHCLDNPGGDEPASLVWGTVDPRFFPHFSVSWLGVGDFKIAAFSAG